MKQKFWITLVTYLAYCIDKVDVAVSLKASNAGQYAIETYRDGKLQATENKTLDADQSIKWTIPTVLQTEAVFIKVKKWN